MPWDSIASKLQSGLVKKRLASTQCWKSAQEKFLPSTWRHITLTETFTCLTHLSRKINPEMEQMPFQIWGSEDLGFSLALLLHRRESWLCKSQFTPLQSRDYTMFQVELVWGVPEAILVKVPPSVNSEQELCCPLFSHRACSGASEFVLPEWGWQSRPDRSLGCWIW